MIEESDVYIFKYLEYEDDEFYAPLFIVAVWPDPYTFLIFSPLEDRYVHVEKFHDRIISLQSKENKIGVMLSDGTLKILEKTPQGIWTLHSVQIYKGFDLWRELKHVTFEFAMSSTLYAYAFYKSTWFYN